MAPPPPKKPKENGLRLTEISSSSARYVAKAAVEMEASAPAPAAVTDRKKKTGKADAGKVTKGRPSSRNVAKKLPPKADAAASAPVPSASAPVPSAALIAAAQSPESSSLSQLNQRLVVQAFTEICRELKIDGMINRAIASVKQLLCVEAASCFVHDEATGELLARDGTEGASPIMVPFGSGIVGSCFATGTSCIIQDAYLDARFDRSVDAATGFQTRNILAVPVLHNTQSGDGAAPAVFAVLQAINSPVGTPFGADDVAVLELLSTLLSGALERAILSESAEREKRRSDALLATSTALYSPGTAPARALCVMQAVRLGLECERASMLLVDEVRLRTIAFD